VLAMLVLACMVSGRPAESQALQGRMITGFAVAINPATHKAYAVNEDAGMVSVTDGRTGSTRVVKVGSGPIAIAINRVTNRIYVTNTDSGSITVLDGEQDKVVATIKGEDHPYVLAVNEATNKVYVTNTYSNAVTVIDGAIKEGVSLLLRAEFFNVFNHTNFTNPTGNITSSNFGTITSARDPRIGQVAAKITF
jgi:YVTN family beta-propeller protein